MKKVINWILNILIIIVVLIIAYLLFENYQMKKLANDNTDAALETYEQLVCSEDQVVADTSHPQITNDEANANDIIGYMMFPSVGESTAILQGDLNDDQTAAMDRGVSHDPNSSMPGEIGNSVFAGHRELFFKHFLDLEVGDTVIINLGDNIYIYEIQSFEIIDPEQVDTVFFDNDEDLLVMYTCYPIEPYTFFNQRMVIKATPVSETTIKDCETVTKSK